MHPGWAQSPLQHSGSLCSENSVVQTRERCWCCVVPGKQQVFMLHVTLVVPVPGNAARPGVSTWARLQLRSGSSRGRCLEWCAGSSAWGTRAAQARAGTQSRALTGLSVWTGRVSLSAAEGDSALPWLSGHVITPVSLRWLRAVPPTRTEKRREQGLFLISRQRACCAGQEGIPAPFPGCSEAGGLCLSLPL